MTVMVLLCQALPIFLLDTRIAWLRGGTLLLYLYDSSCCQRGVMVTRFVKTRVTFFFLAASRIRYYFPQFAEGIHGPHWTCYLLFTNSPKIPLVSIDLVRSNFVPKFRAFGRGTFSRRTFCAAGIILPPQPQLGHKSFDRHHTIKR